MATSQVPSTSPPHGDRPDPPHLANGHQQVMHRALDGRRIQFSGRLDLGAPVTSVAEIAVRRRRHEFTAGSLALGDDVARTLGISEFEQELHYQDGVLLTARTHPYDSKIRLREERLTAVWRGRRHSLFTHLYRATASDALALLRTVQISEHDDGISLTPQAGSGFAAPAVVVKQVPGLGVLEVSPLTAEHAKQLPRWRGLTTRAGELFQDSLSDGEPYFVVATDQLWVTVLPLRDTVIDQVPNLVDQLRLQTVS